MSQEEPVLRPFEIFFGDEPDIVKIGEARAPDAVSAAFGMSLFLEDHKGFVQSAPVGAKARLRAAVTDEEMAASIAEQGIAVLYVENKKVCINHIRSTNSGDACEEARAVMSRKGETLIFAVTPLMATFFIRWPPRSRWAKQVRKKLALVGMF